MSDEDEESSSDSPFDDLDDEASEFDEDPFEALEADDDAIDATDDELDALEMDDEALDAEEDVLDGDAGESSVSDADLDTGAVDDLDSEHGPAAVRDDLGSNVDDGDDFVVDDGTDLASDDRDDTTPDDLGAELLDEGPEPPDDVFVEMDVGEIDEDSVWQDLVEDEDSDEEAHGRTEAGARAEPETEETATAGTVPGATEVEAGEEIVSKQRFCERCEYFSTPPVAECTHPGTEIVELVDNDHFRVSDCPVVEERRDENGRLLSDHL